MVECHRDKVEAVRFESYLTHQLRRFIIKILLLEDCQERINWFKEKFDKLHITDSPKQAINFLNENEYDYIFLDHDLQLYPHEYECSEDDTITGFHVAKWLGSNPDNNKSASIIIHSMNSIGALRMVKALNRPVRVLPFSILCKLIVVT